ncbi:MAG: OmpA family protein, partial [Edaphobacter sp.]
MSVTALSAQEPNPTTQTGPPQQPVQMEKQDNGIYLYRVKVVQRDLDAVNYFHRGGTTTIGFKGTGLLPNA